MTAWSSLALPHLWEEAPSPSIRAIYVAHYLRRYHGTAGTRDGAIVWKRYLVESPKRTGVTTVGTPTFGPSGAGVWSAPTVDANRGLLYVTSGDNYSYPATWHKPTLFLHLI